MNRIYIIRGCVAWDYEDHGFTYMATHSHELALKQLEELEKIKDTDYYYSIEEIAIEDELEALRTTIDVEYNVATGTIVNIKGGGESFLREFNEYDDWEDTPTISVVEEATGHTYEDALYNAEVEIKRRLACKKE